MNKFCMGCRYIVWVFFTIALIAGCSSGKAVPGKPRQIEENTLNLQEHWRRSPVLIGGAYHQSSLSALSNHVAYVQGDPKGVADRIQVVNAADGALVWETRKGQLWGSGPLAIDAERVYIMNDFTIYAYKLDGGQLLWESGRLPSHRSYSLHVSGERLYARDFTTWQVYNFDSLTGSGGGSTSLSTDDGFVLLAELPEFDLFIRHTTLKAVDKTKQQSLWVTTVDDLILGIRWRSVILTGNTLLVGRNVFAFDTRTGQLKWHNEDLYIASNVVVANGFMYALDSRARLVQVDIETGQEIGYIQFTPADTNPNEERYWIATDGQMVFIAFGDSQELIALGP